MHFADAGFLFFEEYFFFDLLDIYLSLNQKNKKPHDESHGAKRLLDEQRNEVQCKDEDEEEDTEVTGYLIEDSLFSSSLILTVE